MYNMSENSKAGKGRVSDESVHVNRPNQNVTTGGAKDDLEYKSKIENLEEETVMSLPLEIIWRIFDILNATGQLKAIHLRISKCLHDFVLSMLYRSPKLRATNFFAFVDCITSSKTVGKNVRLLDLSYINQTGKNAFVAKLLKRCGENLDQFVAPQTSFGFAPLVALKNCKSLKVLDLRLVSETLDLNELFQSVRNLTQLSHLSFPRSSLEISSTNSIEWPPTLKFLRLSGGINDSFLLNVDFPPTIQELELTHCPHVSESGIRIILSRLGKRLKTLRVHYPMPGLKDGSLDYLFDLCPDLINLSLSVDYISDRFFDEDFLGYLPYDRPLRTLNIDSSGMLGTSTRLDPVDLAIALDDGRLPLLKNIWYTARMGWDHNSEYISFIVDTLEERGGGLYVGY